MRNLKDLISLNKHFRSPKRNSNTSKKEFYNYYAGYSDAFVEDVLSYLNLEKGSVILDPWNGSGTTTFVAGKNGYKAIGYDINPVMPIVACARLIPFFSNLHILFERIINQAKRYKSNKVLPNDPFKYWLSDSSIIYLRRIERAIQSVFLARRTYLYAKQQCIYNNLLSCPEMSFFYVTLFRTVTELLRPFKASNPTWIKTPKKEHDKLELTEKNIINCFEKNLSMMIQVINNSTFAA